MKKRIFYGIIILIFTLNVKLFFDVSYIKNEINSIRNTTLHLDNRINDISSNVSRTLNEFYEQKKWIYNAEHNVLSLSKDLKEVKIDFKWSLRELSNDYTVYLFYGAVEGETQNVVKWNEIKAQDLGNLNYACALTIPYLNNYQFKVVAKNNKNIINEKLEYIPFLDKFHKRININAMPNTKTFSKGQVDLKFVVDISNRYDLSFERGTSEIDGNKLKIKNITVKVYSNNQLKNENKILENGSIKNNNASYRKPIRMPEEIKLEEIHYEGNIEYDTDSNEHSKEKIEVIVEDYMGKIYTNVSHEI